MAEKDSQPIITVNRYRLSGVIVTISMITIIAQELVSYKLGFISFDTFILSIVFTIISFIMGLAFGMLVILYRNDRIDTNES